MNRFFSMVAILLCALVHATAAPTSNYFYRISPAKSPLKKEAVLYAPGLEYPVVAKRRHLRGSGLFAIHIRPNGTVGTVEVITTIGHPILDGAAMAAFRRWRFRPRSIRLVRIPVTYQLGALRLPKTPFENLKSPGDGIQITVHAAAP